MLHYPANVSDAVSPAHRVRPSVEQILARRQARLAARVHEFPPDFLHGSVQLAEVYEVLGAAWVEDALFVEEFHDEEGTLVAWSMAWFDDEFLRIEQAVCDEAVDFWGRYHELMASRRRVVRLMIDRDALDDDQEGDAALTMRCSLGRLVELEDAYLDVVRDRDFADPRAIYSQREEILQDSRINLMSLICLCGRLLN